MSVRMPPIELANAKGIINLAGLVPADFAMARMMGNSSATVPVLLTKAATTAVTSITRKKSFTSFVPASLSRRPLMILARPVWNTAPPTTKRPIIMTTAELEKPASASDGVSTLVTSNSARELRATMSERTLSAMKATMVSPKMTRTVPTCPAGEESISPNCDSHPPTCDKATIASENNSMRNVCVSLLRIYFVFRNEQNAQQGAFVQIPCENTEYCTNEQVSL